MRLRSSLVSKDLRDGTGWGSEVLQVGRFVLKEMGLPKDAEVCRRQGEDQARKCSKRIQKKLTLGSGFATVGAHTENTTQHK
jgi:hypothetical protein